MVTQIGVPELEVIDLGGCFLVLLDERADLASGLGPGRDLRWASTQEPGGVHRMWEMFCRLPRRPFLLPGFVVIQTVEQVF